MKIENIEELRVLIETGQRGSLTAAALELNCTPSAASAALKRLEARLNVRLFERSTRSMRLTEQGELLIAYAERALGLLEEGAAIVSESAQALRGAIRLTAPSSITRRLLLPWFDEFMALHPEVELQLSISDSQLDLLRDQLDVAIRYGVLADSNLMAMPLTIARPVAVAAPAYLAKHGTPQHPNELREHDCITYQLRGKRHVDWQFNTPGGGTLEVKVIGKRSADDADIAQQWCVSSYGILHKSSLDVHADIQAKRLIPLFPAFIGDDYPLNAVLPSSRFMPERVRALIRFLQGKFAELETVQHKPPRE